MVTRQQIEEYARNLIREAHQRLPGAEPYEDEGSWIRSEWLGTVFGITPSGKVYTPFANSNVEVCDVCLSTGGCSEERPCGPVPEEYAGEEWHCEVCRDAIFNEALEQAADELGCFVFWVDDNIYLGEEVDPPDED